MAAPDPECLPSLHLQSVMHVHLNGRFISKADALISVEDRGFMFADGVYEVFRAYEGRLFEEEAHLERLQRGLRTLEIEDPSPARLRELHEAALELLRRNGHDRGEATVYLQVTRGSAPRTHHFPSADTPRTTYLASAKFAPARASFDNGVAAVTQPDLRWSRCDLKTINLLPNAWAKQRAVMAGATEAIFIRDGALTDGASTNVFAVVDGELCTPPLSNYLLPGITRAAVLRLAREAGGALEPVERPIFAEELREATELFLTGTTTDVMPVVMLDGAPVGDGAPGDVTRRLQQAFARLTRDFASATDVRSIASEARARAS